jgi:hypothetical protein
MPERNLSLPSAFVPAPDHPKQLLILTFIRISTFFA